MSTLRATNLKGGSAGSAPNLPDGAVATGVITATSFSGSGANLTGIDATALKDAGGNVKIQANPFGAVHTGISTFDVVSVGGTSTFLGNVGVGTAVATDPVKSSNTTKVAAGIVTSYNIFSNRYHGDSAENFFAGTFAGSGDAGIAAGADNNIGIGRSALSVLSSGYRNIAFGCEAGLNVSSGRDNFLVGFEAGCDISTGIHNIAIGSQALLEGTAACYNVAIGIKAGRGNPSNPTDASACNKYITAIGGLAGDSQVAGNGSVYMGYAAFRGAYNAGGTNVTGNDNNIVIGCWAASYYAGCEITNNIVIGAYAGRDAQNGPSTTLRENIYAIII